MVRRHAKNEKAAASGELTATLTSIRRNEEAWIAVIQVAGMLVIEHTGRMENRFGPNWWHKKWSLKTSGSLTFNLQASAFERFELAFRGTHAGEYTNEQPQLVDPFSATVDFTVKSLEPPSPELQKRIDALIEELGNDSFASRERASKNLLKIGPVARPNLLQAAKQSNDPKIRWRTKRLLQRLGG